MKRAQRMNKTFLALSVNMLMIGGVYAADDVQTSTQEKSLEQSTQSSETAAQGSVFTDTSTPTAVASDQVNTAAASSPSSAAEALQKKKAMRHKRVIFKKFLPQMNDNIP